MESSVSLLVCILDVYQIAGSKAWCFQLLFEWYHSAWRTTRWSLCVCEMLYGSDPHPFLHHGVASDETIFRGQGETQSA